MAITIAHAPATIFRKTTRFDLLDKRDDRAEELYEYGRHVEVVWSRDASRIAITDFSGSDTSNVLIFDVQKRKLNDLVPKIDEIMLGTILAAAHHRYSNAVKWKDGNRLQIKVSGYGDAGSGSMNCHYAAETGRITR